MLSWGNFIGHRWQVEVSHTIPSNKKGKMRFSELQKSITSTTQRMLTTKLRELESDGVVKSSSLCRSSASGRIQPNRVWQNIARYTDRNVRMEKWTCW